MNLICKVFGHKWDTSDRYKQNCKRKKCTAWRALMYQRLDPMKPALSWKIFDIERLNFKKL